MLTVKEMFESHGVVLLVLLDKNPDFSTIKEKQIPQISFQKKLLSWYEACRIHFELSQSSKAIFGIPRPIAPIDVVQGFREAFKKNNLPNFGHSPNLRETPLPPKVSMDIV